MKKLTLLLLFLSAVNQIQAQKGNCTNYFTGNEVYSIAEGKNSMWFATECRIVELDKSSGNLNFHVHNMQAGCFSYGYYKLLVDTADNLWLGGQDGLFKFDGINWTPVDISNSLFLLNIDQNNNIWYQSDSLMKYDGNNFISYSIPYPANDIVFDSNGTMWIASSQGLIKFKGSTDTIYDMSNSALLDNNLTTIAIDSTGRLWMSGQWMSDSIFFTYSPFVAEFDGTNWIIHTDSTTGLPNIGPVTDIHIDSTQNVWCLGLNGLAKYNGIVWSMEYTPGTGVDHCFPSSFLVDKTNNKWLGTVGIGALKFDGSTWNKITTSNSGLPGNSVIAVEIDKDGVLWAGTQLSTIYFTDYEYGFVRFDSINWSNYTSLTADIPYKGYAISNDHQGNLWVANENYLYKYDGFNWQKFPVDLVGSQVSMTVDASNHIWVASTYRSLKEFDGSTWTNYPSQDYGFPWGHYEKHVEVDLNNNVWIGTYNHLAKFNSTIWQVYTCTDSTGQPCWDDIQDIKFDQNNNLWLGSGSRGLIKYDGVNFYHYKTKNQGTSYDNIQSIAVDSLNNIWIGTFNNGLFKYNGSIWIQFKTTNADILSNNINDIEIDHNQIWLGTSKGLIKFNSCGGDTVNVGTESFSNITELPNQTYSIQIYPNPATSNLTIQTQEKATIEILNIEGQIIKSINTEEKQTTIGIMDLSSGIYIIKAKTDKGIAVKKFLKE